MRVVYTPDSREKLKQIKTFQGTKPVSFLTRSIRDLSSNPQKGGSVEKYLGIPNPYLFLHINDYYVFYIISDKMIKIEKIYNEREDFMQKMFGINLRTQESIDYWGE